MPDGKTSKGCSKTVGVIMLVLFAFCGLIALCGIVSPVLFPTPIPPVLLASATRLERTHTPSFTASVKVISPTSTDTQTTTPPPTFTEATKNTATLFPTHTVRATDTRWPTVTAKPSSGGNSSSSNYPSGVSAVCRDGSYSYSQHRRGTCSHHGGVAFWVNPPPN